MKSIKFRDFKEFLIHEGVGPGIEDMPIEQYTTLIQAVKKEYGDSVGSFLMDCFMPTGDAVQKGIEDSATHYLFLPPTWEDMDQEWPFEIGGLSALIEALQIFLKYGDVEYPTHCEHDELSVHGYPKTGMDKADADRLEEIGFLWSYEDHCWKSFRYGSC